MADPGNALGWYMDDVSISAVGANMANGIQGCAHCGKQIAEPEDYRIATDGKVVCVPCRRTDTQEEKT